jgi:hypothetical protein
MDRRELLKMIALVTGGAVVGGELFLTGCKSGGGITAAFNAETLAFLDEVAETIIPATSTPGAKAAKVAEFMKIFVNDCYEEADQKAFLDGIPKLNEASKKQINKDFMEASPEDRKKLLISLDKEAKAYMQAKTDKDPTHYFTLMKQLTLLGFFTSKTGATETLRHIQVPGHYDGAYPYKKGDKAWAE